MIVIVEAVMVPRWGIIAPHRAILMVQGRNHFLPRDDSAIGALLSASSPLSARTSSAPRLHTANKWEYNDTQEACRVICNIDKT